MSSPAPEPVAPTSVEAQPASPVRSTSDEGEAAASLQAQRSVDASAVPGLRGLVGLVVAAVALAVVYFLIR